MFLKMTVTVFAALSAAAVLSLTGLAAEGDDSTAAAVSPETNEYYGLLTAISDIEEFIAYDEEPVTRADFIVLLVNGLGLRAYGKNVFSDVLERDYFCAAAKTAAKLGIAEGDKLRPNDVITAQEAAGMVKKACGRELDCGSGGLTKKAAAGIMCALLK